MSTPLIKFEGIDDINPETLTGQIDEWFSALPKEKKRELALEGLESLITEEMLRELRARVAIRVGDMEVEERKKHFSIISNIALSLNTGRGAFMHDT